jgi:hypothetical protein
MPFCKLSTLHLRRLAIKNISAWAKLCSFSMKSYGFVYMFLYEAFLILRNEGIQIYTGLIPASSILIVLLNIPST